MAHISQHINESIMSLAQEDILRFLDSKIFRRTLLPNEVDLNHLFAESKNNQDNSKIAAFWTNTRNVHGSLLSNFKLILHIQHHNLILSRRQP